MLLKKPSDFRNRWSAFQTWQMWVNFPKWPSWLSGPNHDSLPSSHSPISRCLERGRWYGRSCRSPSPGISGAVLMWWYLFGWVNMDILVNSGFTNLGWFMLINCDWWWWLLGLIPTVVNSQETALVHGPRLAGWEGSRDADVDSANWVPGSRRIFSELTVAKRRETAMQHISSSLQPSALFFAGQELTLSLSFLM